MVRFEEKVSKHSTPSVSTLNETVDKDAPADAASDLYDDAVIVEKEELDRAVDDLAAVHISSRESSPDEPEEVEDRVEDGNTSGTKRIIRVIYMKGGRGGRRGHGFGGDEFGSRRGGCCRHGRDFGSDFRGPPPGVPGFAGHGGRRGGPHGRGGKFGGGRFTGGPGPERKRGGSPPAWDGLKFEHSFHHQFRGMRGMGPCYDTDDMVASSLSSDIPPPPLGRGFGGRGRHRGGHGMHFGKGYGGRFDPNFDLGFSGHHNISVDVEIPDGINPDEFDLNEHFAKLRAAYIAKYRAEHGPGDATNDNGKETNGFESLFFEGRGRHGRGRHGHGPGGRHVDRDFLHREWAFGGRRERGFGGFGHGPGHCFEVPSAV